MHQQPLTGGWLLSTHFRMSLIAITVSVVSSDEEESDCDESIVERADCLLKSREVVATASSDASSL